MIKGDSHMSYQITKLILLVFFTAQCQKVLCQKKNNLEPINKKLVFSSKKLHLEQALEMISYSKKLAVRGKTNELKQAERIFLLNFFKFIWANKKVNKRLRSSKYFALKLKNNQLDLDIIANLAEFTFKTQNNYDAISTKITNISNKIADKQKISSSERLRVFELRKLESMVNLARVFDEFAAWGILEILIQDPKIAILKNQCAAADNLHKILSKYAYEFHPKSGVLLLAYDFRNDFAYRKAGPAYLLTLETIAFLLNLRVSHFSLAFVTDKTRYESHMWGKPSRYKVSPMPLASYIYDTYQLRIEKLIALPSVMIKQLQTLYGEKWMQALEMGLEDILTKYFIDDKNANLSRLYNPELRRIKSVFALDYSLTKARHEDQIYFSPSGKVTCSEFVAKALMQCIELLNHKIALDWQELKKNNHQNAPYLLFPIKAARKTKRYSPQEYFDHLLEHNLIQKLKTPSLLSEVIKIK